jgi:LCP family protein required for cell wall assembly
MAGTAPPRPGDPLDASPTTRKVFLVVAGVLAFLLAAGSAVAITGILYFDSKLTKVEAGANCRGEDCLKDVDAHTPCETRLCNYLILGSDSRQGLSKKEQRDIGTGPDAVEGRRADTIIVVSVNAREGRTVVLHIPRDLLVEIPRHGEGKINEAFSFGENTMVKTVRRLTGLKIHHYLEINFRGFRDLVDAVGGVDICVDRRMIDPLAGLRLPRAGCYDMDGKQALAFVRARHVEGDNIPDFSRISRQQQFMRAVIDKLLSAQSLVTDLPQLIRVAQENLVMDDGLNLYDLQDLTRTLSGLGQAGVLFRVVPAIPVEIEGISYVQATPEAEVLFARLRQGRAPGPYGREQASTDLSPAAVSVVVFDDGGGADAQRVVEYLQRAGFEVLGIQPAPDGLRRNSVLGQSGKREQRRVVMSYLPEWPSQQRTDQVRASGADVAVVVGPNPPPVPQ